MNKKYSRFLVPGIIVVGIALRVPFTAIPPILNNIAKSQSISVGQLGLLTTIPLIAFAIFSSFAPKIAHKFGLERAFSWVLGVTIIGSIVRVINTPMLYFGTLLIGIGIAHLNVLLPSIVRTYFPMKVGPITSVFTFSMLLATAVGSSVAVPITIATSWRVFIIILTIILVIALLLWLPNQRFAQKYKRSSQQEQMLEPAPTIESSIWKNGYAWLLLFVCGMQSAMFYVSMAWIPTMAVQTGLSPSVAGVFSGVNSLIGLPFAIVIPIVIANCSRKQRQVLMGIIAFTGVLGYILLLHPNGTFAYWLAVNLLIGVGTSGLFPYVLTTFNLKTNTPTQTAQLSGMVQSGGYLIAALGPALFGYGFSLFHSWAPQIIVILILFVLMIIAILIVEKKDKIL